LFLLFFLFGGIWGHFISKKSFNFFTCARARVQVLRMYIYAPYAPMYYIYIVIIVTYRKNTLGHFRGI
jgi:hypothetical protein